MKNNNIEALDLIGRKITVGDTVVAHIQNHITYVKVEEILKNGLLKTNKAHYCLFPNKVILMSKDIDFVN